MSAAVSLLVDTLQFDVQGRARTAEWRLVDARGLEELVLREQAAVWLVRRLRAVHAFDSAPRTLTDPLRTKALEHAALRLEVEAEAATVVDLLDRAGIEVVLIKGMARSALAGRYPLLDARVTSDVDLLVSPVAIDAATAVLMTAGYALARPDDPPRPGHHHRPALRRESVCVELHESTSTRVEPALAWHRARHAAESVDWNGRPVLVPSATELAWNAIAHAMEDELSGFRLARFLELAALVARGAAIDWDEIALRSRSDEACDATAVPDHPERVVGRWISAALTLVAPDRRPVLAWAEPFDLAMLLSWRLDVLRAPPLGRAMTDRLLEEGGRLMTGLPLEPAPPHTLWHARTRRRIAGRASRVAHRLWRATRMR